MKSILVPFIKDNTSNITSVDDYRPIAINSEASNLYEIIVLNRCVNVISSSDNIPPHPPTPQKKKKNFKLVLSVFCLHVFLQRLMNDSNITLKIVTK